MDAEYDVYVDDATLADSVIGMPKGDTIDWSKVSQSTAVVGSKAPNKFGLYDTRYKGRLKSETVGGAVEK
jgi:hypothetical protein